jgi:hypothetical protein
VSDIHATVAALIAAAGIGTPGVDLFVYEVPAAATRYALIVPDLEGIPCDEYMPGFFQSRFSAIVRDADYQTVMTKAGQLAQALDLFRHDAGPIHIKRMRPTHKPIPYRIPDSDDVEASVNVWVAYSEAP